MYLTLRDYNKQIQTDNLNQILGNDDTVRVQSELAAQAELTSYLTQRYDVQQEFEDTLVWSPTVLYNALQLVTLNYPVYVSTTSYTATDLVTYNSKCYICTGSTTGTFNPSNWQLLGSLYDYYYIPCPFPLFNLSTVYNIGDIVFWNGKIYQCQIASLILTQDVALQYSTYSNLPYQNYFPDDPTNGIKYWGNGTQYGISGFAPNAPAAVAYSNATTYTIGQYVTYNGATWQSLTIGNLNNTPGADIINWQPVTWTYGDNRDQQLVQYMIDISLYHIHSRISPRNIPEFRVKRYDDAVCWLKMVMEGDVTSAIPPLQPPQGRRVRWGSNIKNVNSY
jgi:phage gp36-like protein